MRPGCTAVWSSGVSTKRERELIYTEGNSEKVSRVQGEVFSLSLSLVGCRESWVLSLSGCVSCSVPKCSLLECWSWICHVPPFHSQTGRQASVIRGRQQNSTATHSTPQHRIAQHSTAWNRTAHHRTAQYTTTQHSTAQHHTTLYTTLLRTPQHSSTALRHHTLHHSTP